MKLHVYVAAPYEDAALVREVHAELEKYDIVATSLWADEARGAEDFSTYTPTQLRAAAESNDEDIDRSHAMIVMARKGAGGEMFAEARYAAHLGMPTFWCGRMTLSAWRWNVVRVENPGGATLMLRAASGPAASLVVGSAPLTDEAADVFEQEMIPHIRIRLAECFGLKREK